MLSTEQQDIIENSIWVVNTALKRQGLQADNDLRQSAILYMCKVLERYNPEKDIKWTTFAYKNVYLFIKRTHRKEINKQKYLVGDVFCLPMQFYDEKLGKEEMAKQTLNAIKSRCTPRECKFLELKMMGYKGVEIKEIMKCSKSSIINFMRSIKKKVKNIDVDKNM